MSRKIGVILSYVLMSFEILSTLLLTPFIIKTLGQSEFGVYKLSAAITAYLLLLDFGIGNAIIRYIAKYRTQNNNIRERQFLGVAIIYYTSIGIISLILGGMMVKVFPSFFSRGLNKQEILLGQKLLFITVLNCSVTLMTACYSNVLIAYEKFKVSRICSIIQIIVKMIVIYFLLKKGFRSVSIVETQLILTIILRGYMVFYIFFKIKLYPIFQGLDKEFIYEIIRYSTFIFLQIIATQLNASIDQILIGKLVFSSSIIIGIYGIGTQIVQYYQGIGSAFTSVLMPGIVKLVETTNSYSYIIDEMIRIGRIIFMTLGFIWACFFINGKNFIILWAGQENLMAYYVAVILMFAYLFVLTGSIGSQVLWALNQHKEQAYLKISIVLLNIILTIILIKWNPLIGATVGTFFSLVIGDILVMNWIFKKKFNMSITYYYKNLFRGILPSIIIITLIGLGISKFFGQTWFQFFIKNFIMIIVYFIMMLIYGMNNYEKKLLYSLLKIERFRRVK